MVPDLSWPPSGPPLPEPQADPLLGATVGSFRVVRKLGEGGMGAVYLAEQAVIGSKVAVKFLHEHLASNNSLVQRFYAEARAVNLIGHENIVNIFDMNVLPPRRYYLVMEYLEGEPLSERVARPMAPELAVPILAQVCDALQAAHERGVIHRDLKPENLFLLTRRRQGGAPFVKVLDFGIAKLFSGEVTERTSAGILMGTPEYMAPEQGASEVIDGRADIYALGVIAYRMVTGRLPFTAPGLSDLLVAHRTQAVEPPERHSPAVNAALSAAIQRALAKERERRFATARELRDALEASLHAPQLVVDIQPPPPPPPAPPEPLRPPVPEPSFSPPPERIEAPPRVADALLDLKEPPASFEGSVTRPGGSPRAVQCLDLSRGGMFICAASELPAVFSRVRVALEHPPSDVTCDADVVRQVSPEQARAWCMSPGYAVQFVSPSASFREAIAQRREGRTPSRPPVASPGWLPQRDDAEADRLLSLYSTRGGDPYALLALAPDAEFSEIHQRGRDAKRELEGLKGRPLSAAQRQRLDRLLEALASALERIGTPARRAAHDAQLGNFRGVARCLSAGLTVTALEAERRRFLAQSPSAESRAHVALVSGKAWEAKGDVRQALEHYEKALALDPLNLSLQQRYWTLRRKG